MKITQLKRLALEATITNERGDPVAIPQYEIAAAVKIHPSTFSMYCLGQREMPWQHRYAIADYFKVDPDILDKWVEIDPVHVRVDD